MASKFVRRRIDSSAEEKIVTGAIMSTQFLKEIQEIYDPIFIKNTYAQIVCKWAYEYYDTYQEAPKNHIKDIYDLEKEKIDEAEAKIIEAFLVKLNHQYEMENQGINDQYFIDIALDYFKIRNLDVRSEKVQKLISVGKIDEAEKEFTEYKKVAKATSGWYNPFDKKNILKTFEENDTEVLFTFPGQLGEMIGGFERGWLFSVVGSFKRGKSWMLEETAIQALLKRVPTVYISLEMKKKNLDKRIYKRLTSMTSGEKQNFLYPCFDCALNQSGECDKKERTNHIRLLNDDDELPEFDNESNYQPCIACRNIKKSDYQFASWFETIKRPPLTTTGVIRKVEGFKQMFGDNNLRVKTYPRYSATISDLKRDVDLLMTLEDFIPGLIVVDYAGIIRPEKHGSKEYEALDIIWKELSGWAEELHCVVATGSQVERGTITKSQIEQDGLAGWIGQLAHVDLMFALNQTKEEKRKNLIRINMLAHREKEIDEDVSCVLLQQLELGQPLLDSEMVKYIKQ